MDSDSEHDIPTHDVPAGQTLSDTPMAPPDSNAVADALERRLRQQREQQQQAIASSSYVAFDEDHEKRQAFRRLIDPGILRPNARPLALESLKTLLTLAENILKNPDDLKFHRFKPTNGKIKKLVVDPKGTLEYARAMGFDPEVVEYQPFYVFNKRRVADLQVGAEILQEALEREVAKEERQERAKREEKAVAAAQVANIKQAFLDDRKSRVLQERREREVREARAAVAARRASQPPASPPAPARPMPGSGYTLNGTTVPAAVNEDEDDEDDE